MEKEIKGKEKEWKGNGNREKRERKGSKKERRKGRGKGRKEATDRRLQCTYSGIYGPRSRVASVPSAHPAQRMASEALSIP